MWQLLPFFHWSGLIHKYKKFNISYYWIYVVQTVKFLLNNVMFIRFTSIVMFSESQLTFNAAIELFNEVTLLGIIP